MPSQRIDVHLVVPIRPDTIVSLLEEEGFEVGEVTESRGGPLFSADIVAFVVEYVDDLVIGSLAGVIANLVTKARRSLGNREVNFSVTTKKGGDKYVVKVKGDGNFIQLHPRPDEEE